MKNNIIPGTLYREKKNPENTFFVSKFSCWDDGEVISGYTNNGIEKTYKKKYFCSHFIVDKPNYSSIEEHILPFLTQTPELNEILNRLCRRFHPGGYFHVGDIVYGTKCICYYIPHYDYDHDLIDYPMKITDIREINSYSTAKLILMEGVYKIRQDSELSIPMYQDRYSNIDAYACLRRYDMPY